MTMDPLWLSSADFFDAQHIERVNSMIWTERYSDASDCEFRLSDVEYGMAMIPPGALVTLRETREIMRITSNEIELTEDRGPEFVAKGTSLAQDLLKYRYIPYKINAQYNAKFKMPTQYYLDQVACAIAWDALRNASGTSGLATPDIALDSDFQVANLRISNSVARPASFIKKNRWASMQVSLERFMDFLVRGDMGVRCIRPPAYGRIATIDVNSTPRGNFTLDPYQTYDTLALLDIYMGNDLTYGNTSGNLPVVFVASAGHLADTRYLTDQSNFYNIADVRSGWGNKWVPRSVWYSGIGMRTLLVDGGAPDTDLTAAELTDFYNDLDQAGEIALKQANKQEVIDTGLSPTAPYKYGTDYRLGDKVSVIGEYKYNRAMYITEFTRAWDDEGYREFPGLSMPNDL